MATLGLRKIKAIWNKGSDVIMFVHEVLHKNLSRDPNYIVVVIMSPKFGSSSVSVTELVITSIL